MSEFKVTYKSNKNVIYSCKHHVVWFPKYRRDVLKDGAEVRLNEIILEVCNELKADIIQMEIVPDHGYPMNAHLQNPSDLSVGMV